MFCLVGFVHSTANRGIDPPPPNILIVGGTPALAGEFPYLAYLNIQGGNLCGGTLIGPSTILLAAHCLDRIPEIVGPMIVATVYLNTLSSNGSGPGSITAYSFSYLRHELYNRTNQDNDIALIFISSPVTSIPFATLPSDPAATTVKPTTAKTTKPMTTTTVKPATKMTTKSMSKKPAAVIKAESQTRAFSTYANMTAVVAGWGITTAGSSVGSRVLMKTHTTILDNSVCSLRFPIPPFANMLCAEAPGRGTCLGDSGGPIFVGGVQVGITSFGKINCDGASVYTRVTNYLEWIKMKTNQFKSQPVGPFI